MPAQNNTPGLDTIADILLSQKLIDETKYKEIKLAEAQTGATQEEYIKEKKIVSEEDLIKAKSTLFNIPFVSLGSIPSSPDPCLFFLRFNMNI